MKVFSSINLKAVFSTISLATLFFMVSCDQNTDSKEIAEDMNEEKFSNEKENDAKWLVAAAEIHLKEIELARLAQKNSSTADVIQLAKMIEVEHKGGLNDLQLLATEKGISIPSTLTSDGQDAVGKLKDKKGMDFNDAYCEMMVDDHEEAISEFKDVSSETKDSDIRSWSENLLVVFRKHHERSKVCKEKCEGMKSKS